MVEEVKRWLAAYRSGEISRSELALGMRQFLVQEDPEFIDLAIKEFSDQELHVFWEDLNREVKRCAHMPHPVGFSTNLTEEEDIFNLMLAMRSRYRVLCEIVETEFANRGLNS